MATSKAIQLARRLTDQLKLRLSSLTVAESFDASGNPLITVGTLSTGVKGALVRVVSEATIQKNSIGLDQTVFTPHIVQVMTEANYASTLDSVADVLTTLEKASLYAPAFESGAAVEVWETANGTAPSEAAFATASNKKGVLSPDLQYPLMNQQ